MKKQRAFTANESKSQQQMLNFDDYVDCID